MEDEHGPHGEPRPVDAVTVDVVARGHLVDGLDDEGAVAVATDVPVVAVGTRIDQYELGGVDELVHTVVSGLVLRAAAHAVGDDEERAVVGQFVGGVDQHVALLSVGVYIDFLALVGPCRLEQCQCQQEWNEVLHFGESGYVVRNSVVSSG